MRTVRFVAVLAAVTVVGTGCSGTSASDVAATVNGNEISVAQLEEAVGPGPELGEDAAAPTAQELLARQADILGQLVIYDLVHQDATERGIVPTDAEIDERWERDLEAAGGRDAVQAQIAAQGLTDEFVRLQVRAGMEFERIAEEVIDTETEVVTASHILVDTAEEAQSILDELDAGTPFEQLAQEHSTDPSGAQGGSLGQALPGTYVPEFEAAVWTSELGEIVGPVETQFGFHIIRVDQRGMLAPSELDERIRAEVMGPAAGEYLNHIIADAEVSVDSRFGEWDPQQRRIVVGGELSDDVQDPAPAG